MFTEFISGLKDFVQTIDGSIWVPNDPNSYPATEETLALAKETRDRIVLGAISSLPFPITYDFSLDLPIVGTISVTAELGEAQVMEICSALMDYVSATKQLQPPM